ncbi:MAG TPA: hypothetical protein PLL33_06375 [Paracoccus sp. (in: a-proteobacteria)]|nr:hypothetical protein [Paracoccus sp. (in: a-proteobacteria)]
MSRPQIDLSENRPENLMSLPNRAALEVLKQMYGYYEYEKPVRGVMLTDTLGNAA